MHIAYHTDTTTIAGNENARYHTEIHRLRTSTNKIFSSNPFFNHYIFHYYTNINKN